MLHFYMKEVPNIPERLSAVAACVVLRSKEDEVHEILQKYCALIGDSSGVEPFYDDVMSELDTLCVGN